MEFPSTAKIDHAVEDALTMARGGIDRPWTRSSAQHRLNWAEYEIGVRCFRDAVEHYGLKVEAF